MSNYADNSKRVLYEINDNGNNVVMFCKSCQKKLSTYREVRYHFSVIHEVTKEQFGRVSKAGRLLRK